MQLIDWFELIVSFVFGALVGILICMLSGCTALQEEFARQAQAERQYYAQREAVLYKGAPEDHVLGAWGTPDESSSFGGTINGKTVQYGRCATSPSVRSGVIFMTFLNGALSSWYVTQC